jgi:hypothetical protein
LVIRQLLCVDTGYWTKSAYHTAKDCVFLSINSGFEVLCVGTPSSLELLVENWMQIFYIGVFCWQYLGQLVVFLERFYTDFEDVYLMERSSPGEIVQRSSCKLLFLWWVHHFKS